MSVRILLIEDNAGDARLLRETLKEHPRESFEITHITSLGELFDIPIDDGFEVVILDLNLPDSSGLETFEKARYQLPNFPIIPLTGLEDEALAGKLLQMGAQDYLVKGSVSGPFLLERTIRYSIERFQLQLQLKESADKLRANEQNLRHIVENHTDGIFVVDSGGQIQFANHSADRVLGCETKDLLGSPFPYEISNNGPIEQEIRKPDGQRSTLESTALKIEWEGKSATLISMHDITLRKRMVDNLVQQQKKLAVSQLSAGIAHEFNNILAVIKMSSELLLGGDFGKEETDDYLNRIRHNTTRAGTLVRRLLAFAESKELRQSTMDLNDVLRGAESLLENVFPPNIELEIHPSDLPVIVEADRSSLEQCILNVAFNARDAMPKGGKFTIATKWSESSHPGPHSGEPFDSQSFACIEMIDSGDGMPPNTRERIFEPFFTTKDPDKGTGLGLSTVYSAIEEHKGWIEVESEEGQGTKLSLYLPLSKRRLQRKPMETAAPPQFLSISRRKESCWWRTSRTFGTFSGSSSEERDLRYWKRPLRRRLWRFLTAKLRVLGFSSQILICREWMDSS